MTKRIFCDECGHKGVCKVEDAARKLMEQLSQVVKKQDKWEWLPFTMNVGYGCEHFISIPEDKPENPKKGFYCETCKYKDNDVNFFPCTNCKQIKENYYEMKPSDNNKKLNCCARCVHHKKGIYDKDSPCFECFKDDHQMYLSTVFQMDTTSRIKHAPLWR